MSWRHILRGLRLQWLLVAQHSVRGMSGSHAGSLPTMVLVAKSFSLLMAMKQVKKQPCGRLNSTTRSLQKLLWQLHHKDKIPMIFVNTMVMMQCDSSLLHVNRYSSSRSEERRVGKEMKLGQRE